MYRWFRLGLKILGTGGIIAPWFLPLLGHINIAIFAVSGALLLGMAILDLITTYKSTQVKNFTIAALLITLISVVAPIVLTGLLLFTSLSFLSAPFMPMIVIGTSLGGVLLPTLFAIFSPSDDLRSRVWKKVSLFKSIGHIFGGIGKKQKNDNLFKAVSIGAGFTGIAFFLGAGIGLALKTYAAKSGFTAIITTIGVGHVLAPAIILAGMVAVATAISMIALTAANPNWMSPAANNNNLAANSDVTTYGNVSGKLPPSGFGNPAAAGAEDEDEDEDEHKHGIANPGEQQQDLLVDRPFVPYNQEEEDASYHSRYQGSSSRG